MDVPNPTIDRRPATIMLVVVAVFVFIAGLVAVGGYAYQQFFVTTAKFRWRADLGCAFLHGELVFGEQQINYFSGPGGPCRFMALNLQSGVVRPIGFAMPEGGLGVVVDGDRLWGVSRTEVMETDGIEVKRYQPKFTLGQLSCPFILNGQLTTIAPDENGRTRLYTFVDGEWRPGRQIALPGIGRTWAFDEERGRERMVPRTSRNGAATIGGWVYTRAKQIGDDVHLVSISAATGPPVVAYRVGFDFVPDEREVSSALAPANDEPDTVGWFQLDQRHFNWMTVPAKINGEFVLATPSEPFFWKPVPSKPGQFEQAVIQVEQLAGQAAHDGRIVFAGDDIYLVSVSRFQSLTLYRLHGDLFERTPHSVPGNAELMFAYQKTITGLAIMVVMLSHLILLGGAIRLVRSRGVGHYSCGHEIVKLGPLGRRWLARSIDVSLLLSPFLLVTIWAVSANKPEELMVAQGELMNDLSRYPLDALLDILRQQLREWQYLSYSIAACLWAFTVFITSTIVQARWGFTSGKWICGLRVVRTTLRPCGLLRSLLRELLFYVDVCCLISPIPGVVAILLTDYRQRLGDMAADTIVIDTQSCPKSLPE